MRTSELTRRSIIISLASLIKLPAAIGFSESTERIVVAPVCVGIDSQLKELSACLASEFRHRIVIGPHSPVIVPGTNQTQVLASSNLLYQLSGAIRPKWDRLLGVTDSDLSYPGRTFVFGAADERRRVAVLSLYRLYPSPPNEELLIKRAAKEAAHELGHTYGLAHCANRSCVMTFSSTVEEIDSKGSMFCSVHAKELAHRMRIF